MSDKIKITIDRSKWCTPRCGKGSAALLNPEGFMCCLGFIALHHMKGREAKIRERAMPRDCLTPDDAPALVMSEIDDFSRHLNTDLSLGAAQINDDEHTNLDDKERNLLNLFKNTPYELEFVGEPLPREEPPEP